MTTIGILGSRGQIGAGLHNYLSSMGYQVLGLDILNGLDEDLRIIDLPKLISLVKESDFVIFLAFDVGGSKYLQNYQNAISFIENNMKIMTNTFGVLGQEGVPFIFASSQMAGMHHSTYGQLKALGEKWTRALGGRVMRFWNVYGLENDPSKSHVITDFIRMGIEGNEIKMLTSGTEKRDFLYVDDCCESIETIIQNFNNSEIPDLIDVASFEYTTIKELAELIGLKLNVEVRVSEGRDLVQDGKNFDPNTDILRFWKPRTKLEDGISKIILEVRSAIFISETSD